MAMRRYARSAAVMAVTACAGWGQAAPPAPAFEVASIRPSQGGREGGHFGPRENIQFSPDSVTMRNVSLRSCLRWAYHVMDYQVTGPDWLGSERFDIAAKAAGVTPEDQLRTMMQGLMAERFHVTLHRTSKEFSAYVLVVAKGGPKFKESPTDGEMNIDPDRDRMSVTIQRAPVSQLVDGLSNILRAPVIDETGLTGKYDVTIDASKYVPDMGGHMEGGGPGGGGPGGGGGMGGGRAPIDPIAIIMTGLQAELGLKLESKKMTLDLLVVDHADKVPTEN